MPLNVEDVVQFFANLSEEDNLKVAVKESMKGGVIAGSSTAIGGLVGGPIGMAVGGALGGATAAYMSWGKYESIASVLLKMQKMQKQQLYDQAMIIFHRLSINDLASLTTLVQGNNDIRTELMNGMIDFVHDQLKLDIID